MKRVLQEIGQTPGIVLYTITNRELSEELEHGGGAHAIATHRGGAGLGRRRGHGMKPNADEVLSEFSAARIPFEQFAASPEWRSLPFLIQLAAQSSSQCRKSPSKRTIPPV
jgi:hypothetical protein